MSVLRRKLARDLFRLKGQVITISLVMACGIMSMIMLRGTFASLIRARDEYYAERRFGDAFARLHRAPDAIAWRLERVPGVAEVYTRVVEDVMVPMPDVPDPIAGRIVSIPDQGPPPMCGVVLVAGRMPAPHASDEVVILEKFAAAHRLQPGDTIPAVLNGTLRHLHVVGLGMSPEYIFAMSGREIVSDERRFVVMWMPRAAVASVFRMEGAFNDAVLRVQPGASTPAVLDGVDRVLAPYGGFHAVARDRQPSNYALSGELDQLRSLALMIPSVFLAVAAFLVNVVISRLVYLERTQIAILKALGRSRGEIALHYLGLVASIVAIGSVLGLTLGVWSGGWMTRLYTHFFRFPHGEYRLSLGLTLATLGVALGAAVGGALMAVQRVLKLPAAQAMRPPTPPNYRRRALRRLGKVLGPAPMMIVREITRRPWRFLLSTAAIAMGVGIFILGRFSWDSFDRLFEEDFLRQHHEDLVVTFTESRPERAVQELAHLPGVRLAEGTRVVPVRFHAGSHWRDSMITGMPYPSELRQLYTGRNTRVAPPPEGVIMTDKLAEVLGVKVGDRVEVEVLEGEWPVRSLPVAALIDEPFGLQAYARSDWLATFLREEPRVSGVLLRVEPERLDDVRQRLKEMPDVAGTTSTRSIIDRYREQTGQTISVITLILTLSAAAIAIGVVYNNARIALSLRSRDLASLRVLGFTRREISSILLGELAGQVLLGIPLGLVFGWAWARIYAATINPELLRFPFYIAPRTYGTAALIALISGVISALLVRRRLDDLDLIAVLKATE